MAWYSEAEVGSWLREQGLHSEHLTVWEQELRDVVMKREIEAKEELKVLKKAQFLQGPGDD